MLPIVIVDDAREDAFLAQRVLAHCKIQNPIILLTKGEECIDFFRAHPPYQDRKLPCLLLLDMVMSPLNGLDVLRKLREIPAARGSVLVMLSGLTDLKTVQEGYQLGAHTFLVKPLLVEDVMQMLSAIRALAVQKVENGYAISLSVSHLAAFPGNDLRRASSTIIGK